MLLARLYYQRIFILVTSLLVIAALSGYRPSSAAALALLLVGVVVLGLPHGCLDPQVARKALGGRWGYHAVAFYGVYSLLALGYCLFWRWQPTVGLCGFLAIGALHFGSDWQDRGTRWTRLGYGLTVVALPALSHPAEVMHIYSLLGTPSAREIVAGSRGAAVVGLVVGTAGAIRQCTLRRSDLIEYLLIVAGAVVLEPLVYFACYFSLLHSPRHLLETAADLGIETLRSVFSRTLPVYVATVGLLVLLYYAAPGVSLEGRLLQTVFIGLASLTIPHMLLESCA
jgi:Brp/Blh family beta-carotene 15,15'-monooxygenase